MRPRESSRSVTSRARARELRDPRALRDPSRSSRHPSHPRDPAARGRQSHRPGPRPGPFRRPGFPLPLAPPPNPLSSRAGCRRGCRWRRQLPRGARERLRRRSDPRDPRRASSRARLRRHQRPREAPPDRFRSIGVHRSDHRARRSTRRVRRWGFAAGSRPRDPPRRSRRLRRDLSGVASRRGGDPSGFRRHAEDPSNAPAAFAVVHEIHPEVVRGHIRRRGPGPVPVRALRARMGRRRKAASWRFFSCDRNATRTSAGGFEPCHAGRRREGFRKERLRGVSRQRAGVEPDDPRVAGGAPSRANRRRRRLRRRRGGDRTLAGRRRRRGRRRERRL